MKPTLFIAVLFTCFQKVSSQSSQPYSIQRELSDIASFHPRQTGYEHYQGYQGTATGSQFFMDNWYPGVVISTDKPQTSNNYLLLYDKMRQLLFARQSDSDVPVLIETNKILNFIIKADNTHKFVPASKYDSSDKNNFYEVLAEGNNVTLLKLINTVLDKADRGTSTGVWEGKFTDAYVDHNVYFIFYNGVLKKVNLTYKDIRKALREYQDKLDNYHNTHYDDANDEIHYVKLINTVNN